MDKYDELYKSKCADCEEFQDALEEMEQEEKAQQEGEAACKALEETINKNRKEAKKSKAYQEMMKFHKKNLKEIIKQSGPWEWSWITDYIGEYLKWIRDYYELGINVIGMEIKDTEEFNDPTHPTRLEIAQKLVDAWEEAFGEDSNFFNERVSAEIFFKLLAENIGELWD